MPRINRHGYIVGGVCDRAFQARKGRQEGAEIAWLDAKERGCVQFRKNGWMRLRRNLDPPPYNRFPAAQEIGYGRMTQEVFPILIKSKRCFRELTMRKWIYDLAGSELACDAETPLGPFTFSLGSPHQPGLYARVYGGKP